MTARGWLVALVTITACANKSATDHIRPSPSPPLRVVLNEKLVRDLAILTTQAEPTPALALLASRGDVDGVVSMLVDDRRFTNTVVPTMLLEDYRFPAYLSVGRLYTLNQDNPAQPMYLHKPCKPAEATSVEPWWALGTQVMVCNDSYLPDAVNMGTLPGRPKDSPPLCGSSRGSGNRETTGPPSECGCGHNLIHCRRDMAMRTEVRTSLAAEVYDTIGYVVASGAPLQIIYTSNATVRDRNAEVMYRMHDAARGKPWRDGLEEFAKPVLKPRAEAFPGMHAGILTATDLARFTDVPRSEMMSYFAMMTCSSSDGAHVNAHQALGVDTASLRLESGGKDYLAHQVGCTNCHARLENSIPFFGAWRSIFHSAEIEPERQVIKEGKVYLNDIDDLRGTVNTTPQAFAEVVTAQPEFARCQAGRIAKYIFNGGVDPELQEHLEAMIAARKPAREVLKTALVAYVQRMLEAVKTAPALEAAVDPKHMVPFDAAAVRPFDKPLVEALSACEDCHGDGDEWMDQAIKSHQTTALHLLRMADMVASAAMPKKAVIPAPAREAIVTRLCQAAWNDPALGIETAGALLGYRRPASVHEFGTVVGLFNHSAPAATDPWKVPELMMKPGNNFLTPGTAATYGFETLRVCRAQAKTPADVETCMDKVLDDGAFLRPSTASP